ncbi:MAG TPA: Uma2 family endonuclease [Candidatus Lokiarchaeia archaeon]|nr:Uma2 family endonuclease [Candidatus Lokiarchaeia archaeon]
MEETEITVKIPLSVKKALESADIDVNVAVSNAINEILQRSSIKEHYTEVILQNKEINAITAEDIPPGNFLYIPDLSLEQYEAIVDETGWEYLDGILIHHSPESNIHNAIFNLINHRAMSTLDPASIILRTSHVALNIYQDKPEPDLMAFSKDDFRRAKRADGSESEIIESAPLLVIEIISKSSSKNDEIKKQKYLSKGIKEYWRIYCHDDPLKVMVCWLKKGIYEETEYTAGEIRSRILPDFAITFEELSNPDISR